MTSPAYVLKKLKSLDYRQRLLEDLDDLELEIAGYCREYGTDVLMGYKVDLDNGRVTLKKLPTRDLKQLEMELKQMVEEKQSYETQESKMSIDYSEELAPSLSSEPTRRKRRT